MSHVSFRSPLVIGSLLLSFISTSATAAGEEPANWKAGVATAVITPDGPVWMAGYASRTKPAEGKAQDLFAKALAFDDAAEARYTSDDQIAASDLKRWLKKAIEIQWDYKNIVKRKGKLERLK
jgi:hypothetical protein